MSLALQNLRILIADDSSDNRILVQFIFSTHGAVVESAENGLEAFRMGMDGTFDVILKDIQIPELDTKPFSQDDLIRTIVSQTKK